MFLLACITLGALLLSTQVLSMYLPTNKHAVRGILMAFPLSSPIPITPSSPPRLRGASHLPHCVQYDVYDPRVTHGTYIKCTERDDAPNPAAHESLSIDPPHFCPVPLPALLVLPCLATRPARCYQLIHYLSMQSQHPHPYR